MLRPESNQSCLNSPRQQAKTQNCPCSLTRIWHQTSDRPSEHTRRYQTHPLAQNCGDEFLHVECEKHVGKCRLSSSHDHQTWLPAACCSPGLLNLIQNALPQDTQTRSKNEPSLGPGFENSRAREFCREFLGEFSR